MAAAAPAGPAPMMARSTVLMTARIVNGYHSLRGGGVWGGGVAQGGSVPAAKDFAFRRWEGAEKPPAWPDVRW